MRKWDKVTVGHNGVGGLFLAVLAVLYGFSEDPHAEYVETGAGYRWLVAITGFLFFINGLSLMATTIGLSSRKRWGRQLTLACAAYGIVVGVGTIAATQLFWIRPFAHAVGEIYESLHDERVTRAVVGMEMFKQYYLQIFAIIDSIVLFWLVWMKSDMLEP